MLISLKKFMQRLQMNTTRTIAFGFLSAIVIGGVILMLPISSADGTWTNPIDALFMSTTSICVTGLVTFVTASHWSLFGKIIILILIQLGGLGVITMVMSVFIIVGKRITLRDRMLIQETYNLDTLSGLVKLVKKILAGTLVVELVGAVLYSFQFIPEFGFVRGVGYSIFHAVSAFCNAGIDLIGETSFIPYMTNPLINITTMLLIVLGGLGFIVWWDVVRVFKESRKKDVKNYRPFQNLALHSKLVLVITGILIAFGTLVYFVLEFNNPGTIGNLNVFQKFMASMFQSVTTRTAGFASFPQENMREGSTLVTLLLMIVGGSPAGTAGGMKTTTVGMVVLTVLAVVRGKTNTEVFERKIAQESLRTALAVVVISIGVVLSASLLICAVEDISLVDTLFEVVSAIGTVGLSRGVTADLCMFSKIILIITMYIGRIGPITMAVAFSVRHSKKDTMRELPERRIIIG